MRCVWPGQSRETLLIRRVSPVFKGTAFLQTGGNLKTERIRGKYAVTENLEFLNKRTVLSGQKATSEKEAAMM